MKNTRLLLIAVLSLLLAAACGNRKDNGGQPAAQFEMETFSDDTLCVLFEGVSEPNCNVSYSIMYASGQDAAFINQILVKNLFPQAGDSTGLEKAVHEEMMQITDDYRQTLSGVTRKSIADGSFPEASASYRRSVATSSSTVNGKVLVYKADYEEKAYGESDSLVNETVMNINLESRSLITLDDIFVPGYKDRLNNKIAERMARMFGAADFEGLQKKGFFPDGIPYAPYNFVIADHSITFVYNPFEAAGRSYGIIKLEIEAKDMKDIMEKKWISFFAKK